MSQQIIVNRYITALINSVGTGDLEATLKSTQAYATLMVEHEALFKTLINPLVSVTNKISLIQSVLNGKASKEIDNFFKVVTAKKRLNLLPQFINRLGQAILALQNIQIIHISTATDIDSSLKQSLIDFVKTKTDTNVDPRFTVQPDLLGGFKAQFGNKVIDATVENNLDLLKVQFNN